MTDSKVTDSKVAGSKTMPPRDLAVCACVAVVAGLACLRAMVSFEVLPYFDTDPLLLPVPPTGVSPAVSLGMDVVSLVAAGVLITLVPASGAWWWRIDGLLVALGAVSVLWHGVFGSGDRLGHLATGASWAAALAGAAALMRAAGAGGVARAAAAWSGAAMLGVVGALAVASVYDVVVEHPATVATYKQDKEAFLASRGWEIGSAEARSFERRLNQPEATGWFGLSNVMASFGAAALAAAVGWGAALVREHGVSGRKLWPAGVLGLVAIVVLGTTGSKGGWAVGLLASGVVVAGVVARKRVPERVTLAIGPAVIGVVLLAVLGRGVIGTAIGELSVLFRAFYIEAAARVFAGEPIFGVGPEGFQEAYLRAKNPLSPEAVQSPHSVLFDWLATLGVFAVAWWAVLIGGALRAGSSVVRTDQEDGQTDPAMAMRALALGVCAVTFGAAIFERSATEPAAAVARLAGAAVWFGVALLVVRAGVIGRRLMLGGAALALLAHMQIEVTGVWDGAAALAFGLIGLAAVRTHGATAPDRMGVVGGSAVAAVGVGVGVAGLPGLMAWESGLKAGYEEASPVGRLRLDLAAAEASRDSAVADAALADLARMSGRALTGLPAEDLSGVLAEVSAEAGVRAAEQLEASVAARPGHRATRSALVRALLTGAGDRVAAGSPLGSGWPLAEGAVAVAEAGTAVSPREAGAWRDLASAARGAVFVAGDSPEAGGWLTEWREAAVRAAELDPYGPDAAWRAAVSCDETGDLAGRARWAAEAVRRQAFVRLDPLVGLDERELRRARRWADGE